MIELPAGINSALGRRPEAGALSEDFWRSLHYFSLYRLVIAALLAVGFILTGGSANLGSQSPLLFKVVAWSYLFLAFVFLSFQRQFRHGFDVQLSIQVACDVLALTLLMYASGGAKSGFAVMLLVVVAGAGLVGQGRLTLFYAALASLAVLFEQALRMFRFGSEAEDFFRPGLTSIGFFATAIIAQLLARRVVANELLARQRGRELADQLRINRQVIRDMQDGVLVIDEAGRIRQHNPQAEVLLGVRPVENAPLANYSPPLAEHLRSRGEESENETTEIIRVAESGRILGVRFLPPAEGGNMLIYLEDIERVQAQAQQIKLAALGRLTANIAHEIRNPLAAISHAAELLAEEAQGDTGRRLLHIIGDNSARLNSLVTEVLELGRRDRSQAERIPLTAFLHQFLDEYGLHHADARLRVRLTVADGVAIGFDRAHLHRVVENLLTNALRYASAAEGAVRIEAKSSAPGRVELHIIDDGPGIPTADRGKVFEPFFTTRGSGTGLGLYIARELCDANGAQLELLTYGSAGAHFRVTGKGGEWQPNWNAEAAMD